MQLQSDEVGGQKNAWPVARVFGEESKGVTRLDFETVEEVGANGLHGDSVSILKAEIVALP